MEKRKHNKPKKLKIKARKETPNKEPNKPPRVINSIPK